MGILAGEVTIRAIEVRDAEAVAALAAQLGYERTSEAVAEWIAGLPGRARTQAAFVACLGGVEDEVVGWIEASIENRLQAASYALIGGLVVKEGLRSMGIGSRLCREVERWSREQGLDTVRVTSRSSREEAHRFYLREGYRHRKTSLVFEKRISN